MPLSPRGGTALEHDAIHLRRFVLDGEVKVSRSGRAQVRDLARYPVQGETPLEHVARAANQLGDAQDRRSGRRKVELHGAVETTLILRCPWEAQSSPQNVVGKPIPGRVSPTFVTLRARKPELYLRPGDHFSHLASRETHPLIHTRAGLSCALARNPCGAPFLYVTRCFKEGKDC